MKYSRVGKNAKLGDGGFNRSTRNSSITFVSTDKSILEFKKELCRIEGLTTSEYRTQKSGYGGKKTIFNFRVLSDERLTEVDRLPITDILTDLNKEDLYLWYFDDGSWHKSRNTMHLYSNMLNEQESNVLMDVIEGLYGIRPRLRTDRKKDGRSFYYLYFPRELVKRFRPEVKEYIEANGIESMYYKVGGKDYEEKSA